MSDTAEPPVIAALELEVTPADYEAFNLHVGFSPRLRARWRRQFAAMYAAGAAILVGWNLLAHGIADFRWEDHLLVPLASVLLAAAVLTPITYALHRWNLRRAVRAMLGTAPRDVFLGPKRIEATAEAITVTGRASRGRYEWAAVTGIEETPDLLLLMLGATMAIIVPKRGQSPAALDALRAAVAAHRQGRDGPSQTHP